MELCPICSKELKSKQALGSHLYYNHNKAYEGRGHVLKLTLKSGDTAILEIPTSICVEDVNLIKSMLYTIV